MNITRTCDRCGKLVPANAPDNLCLVCLFDTADDVDADTCGAPDPTNRITSAEEPTRTPVFGDYELLGELGRGGQGVVYRARHRGLGRLVALKTIPPAHLAGSQARERFRLEASTASRLDHPNIVPIYEVGERDGFCFYSMKLVEGTTIQQLVSHDLPDAAYCRRIATILAKIAHAVHHAHQRGVLHRDLKPSNVLLDHQHEPHVSDFGLARLTDEDSSLTLSQALIGTPAYLAPEVAMGGAHQATVAADIYGLGAILFQLLTGRAAFGGTTVAETLRAVQDDEPARPSRLNPSVPADVETICLKCLQKEPAKRYVTAEELADDLARFLRDEPIKARPVKRTERVWRWCRRKPVIAALAASLAVVFVAGLAGVLTQWRRAENKSEENRSQVAQLSVLSGVQLMLAGDYFKSLLWFAEALRTDAGNSEREEIHRSRIAAVLQQSPRLVQIISHHGHPIVGAAFSGRDDRLATVGLEDRVARVWELPSGKLLMETRRLAAVPYSVSFSPDGTRLLVVLTDNTALFLDATTGDQIGGLLTHLLEGAWDSALFPAFDSIGQSLVTQTKEMQLQVWYTRTLQPRGKPMLHANKIERMQFNADGSRLFTRTEGPRNFAWDTETGELLPFPLTGADAMGSLFMGPQADLALLGGRVRRFTASLSLSGRRESEFETRNSEFGISSEPLLGDDWLLWAAFSPEGGRVLTASRDRTARVWDAVTGKPLTPPLPHDQGVSRASFSPDGHRVLTVSDDNLTRVWDADTGEPLTPPIPHARGAGPSAFSSSGRYLLTVHPSYVACLWDLHQETSPPALLKPSHPGGGVNETAPRGGAFFSRGMDNLIRVSKAIDSLGVPLHPLSVKTIPAHAWFDDTSRFVLLEGELARVQVWEAASGMPLTPQIQSYYTLDESASKRVRLPTIGLPADDLVQLAQLLAGSRLDGRGGWTLLELEELNAVLERFGEKSGIGPTLITSAARNSGESLIGPTAASPVRWHQHEAVAAEGASDWWAATFHWQRLSSLQPSSPEIAQRLAYTLKCAANASTRSYRERRSMIPPRDPRASASQIDLTEYYTAPITDGFSDARREVGLPTGLQTLNGVTFDVRGLIQLFGRGPEFVRLKRPEQVAGIRLQQRAARLHLLHTAQWADTREGEEIGSLTIHYSNGQRQRLPIEHAVNVAGDWCQPSVEMKQAEVAWTGTTALASANQGALRLYKYTWLNPRPDWEIAQVDLTSARTKASYVLVAMTAE